LLFEATVDGRVIRVEVRGEAGRYQVAIEGDWLDVEYVETQRHFAALLAAGRSYDVALERDADGYTVSLGAARFAVQLEDATRAEAAVAPKSGHGPARVVAPMPGRIVRVLVESGQSVAAGQGVVVMEAMKMENELRAPRDGRVSGVHVTQGQAVEAGALLALVE
jgi:biotin carboxyl carrier protein